VSRPIGRGEGTVLSRVQYARLLDVLTSLSDDEWALPTECPGWTVKDVAAHVLGNLECVLKPREFLRQVREGKRLDPEHPYDGLNAYQVRHYAPLSPDGLTRRMAEIAEPALRMRARTPWLLRHLVRPSLDVVGRVPMAYVLDVVYTRDTYLHRVDVCRATGRDIVVDEVERRIVEDLVSEWAARHGQPYRLRLTGPAGGTYGDGAGEEIVCDAVEFTRFVSGRGEPEGLLATRAQY
jgi:uncharacterized protein (TIGR03083 family)